MGGPRILGAQHFPPQVILHDLPDQIPLEETDDSVRQVVRALT